MTDENIRLTFPVLRFHRDIMIVPDEETLRIVPSPDVKRVLSGSTLVDVHGRSATICGARVARGVGPLFGLSVFLTLRIVRAELDLAYEAEPLSADRIREMVRVRLSDSPADRRRLTSVTQADTVAGIMRVLGDDFVAAKWRPWGVFRNTSIEHCLNIEMT